MKPSLLAVVSSSCQLFSGTGTALFDWLKLAAADLDITLVVDTRVSMSFNAAAAFCRQSGIELIASGGEQIPGCPDFLPIDAARILQSRRWTFVECVSWASAATNNEILENCHPDTRILFTPHTQPSWTLGQHSSFFMVEPVFKRMCERSTVVFLDSERELDERGTFGRFHQKSVCIPLGVDTTVFQVGPSENVSGRTTILTVADFRESRKRSGRLLDVLRDVMVADANVEAVLVGREAEKLLVLPEFQARTKLLGFVELERLVNLYKTSTVLVSLSQFEAFGLPLAEALCCGTPIVIAKQQATTDIFGGMPGVTICDDDSSLSFVKAIHRTISHPSNRNEIADAAQNRFSFQSTYGRKLKVVTKLLKSDEKVH